MNEQILTEIHQLREEVRELRDSMIRMETAFNGGPGTWHICKVHVEEINALKNAGRLIGLRMAAMAGGISVMIVLMNLFAPVIASRLGLWHTVPVTTSQPAKP